MYFHRKKSESFELLKVALYLHRIPLYFRTCSLPGNLQIESNQSNESNESNSDTHVRYQEDAGKVALTLAEHILSHLYIGQKFCPM